MFSHIHLGTDDFERAFAFYSKLLVPLRFDLKFCDPERGWAAWKLPDQNRPLFVIGTPHDGRAATPGNGSMVALMADSRQVVDAVYAIALAEGAKDEGTPGPRPDYHEHYYGAYFRDLDDNKLCVCCHEPLPTQRLRAQNQAQ